MADFQKGNIGEFIYNDVNNGYWSSTENDYATAFLLGFDDGAIYTFIRIPIIGSAQYEHSEIGQ